MDMPNITIEDFVASTQGKWVVRIEQQDGTYKTLYLEKKDKDAQCMTLVNTAMELFGYDITKKSPIAAPTAFQSFQNGHPDFIKIETNDWSQCIAGDIAYLAPTPMNLAGHVFLVLGKIAGGVKGYDQNYPEEYPCHIQQHHDKNFIGVLRHKSLVIKKRMKYWEKVEQVVYTKDSNGKVQDYWVIWVKDDGSKTKRLVAKKPAIKTNLVLTAAEEGQLNDWTNVELLKTLEQGSDFDFSDFMDNNIDLFFKA